MAYEQAAAPRSATYTDRLSQVVARARHNTERFQVLIDRIEGNPTPLNSTKESDSPSTTLPAAIGTLEELTERLANQINYLNDRF